MSKEASVVIECVDCGRKFEVSADEQAWYKEKGFELPKRCQSCRKSRRGSRSRSRKQG